MGHEADVIESFQILDTRIQIHCTTDNQGLRAPIFWGQVTKSKKKQKVQNGVHLGSYLVMCHISSLTWIKSTCNSTSVSKKEVFPAIKQVCMC